MKINICGDFTTEGKGLQSVMDGTALSQGVLSVLKDGDINVVNLEAPVRGKNKLGFVSPERRYEAPTVARPPQM